MYNDYFKFCCSPFENTLDQRFLFLSQCHKEVIAALLYFVRERKSFAMVCGDVGAGKTMIVQHLLGKLPSSVLPIMAPYPDAEYAELLRYIAWRCGLSTKGKELLPLSDELRTALANASVHGKQVILIIDEAHLLSASNLENLRLLSNIELSNRKLLQILLIGQKELALKLGRAELRQLSQRININRVLCPMSLEETINYLDHRLRIAGRSFYGCFERTCGKLVYELTGGVPRSINRLCDTALLICMTQEGEKVNKKIIKSAQAALASDSTLSHGEYPRVALRGGKKLWPAFAAAAVLLPAIVYFGYGGSFWKGDHEPAARLKRGLFSQAVRAPGLGGKRFEAPRPKAPTSVSQGARRTEAAPPSPQQAAVSVPLAPGAKTRPEEGIATGAQAASGVSPPSGKENSGSLVSGQPIARDRVFGATTAKSFPEKSVSPKKNSGSLASGQPVARDRTFGATTAKSFPGKSVSPKENSGSLASGQPVARDRVFGATTAKSFPGKSVWPIDASLPAPAREQSREATDLFSRPDFNLLRVKKGDSLCRIAARLFPEDPSSGLKWIVAANPQIHDKNLILIDQTLKIPEKKSKTAHAGIAK